MTVTIGLMLLASIVGYVIGWHDRDSEVARPYDYEREGL